MLQQAVKAVLKRREKPDLVNASIINQNGAELIKFMGISKADAGVLSRIVDR